MQEKSAGAIVFRMDGEQILYLLLKYGAGHWDCVKGHVEPDEEEEETVLREAEEEAGLRDLELVPGFRERINYEFVREKDKVSKEVAFYIGHTKTSEIKLSVEHSDYKWLPYPQALKLLTFKTGKDLLKQADMFLKGRLA